RLGTVGVRPGEHRARRGTVRRSGAGVPSARVFGVRVPPPQLRYLGGVNDPGNGKLRISNADREQVLQHLQEALAQGMITADELAERSDRALNATTRADIDPLV